MSLSRFVRLKPGKEKSLLRCHPWIFSGAIEEIPADCIPGELLEVLASDGQFLAVAYFHPQQSLAGRVLSFVKKPPEEILREKIDQALKRREPFYSEKTNAYRLVNAEGDGLPGLVVDRYNDILVIQCTTAGMELLKSLIVEIFVERLSPKAIYEKSHGLARQQEGLDDKEGFLWGEAPDEVQIVENNLVLSFSLKEGQKSGFFLDQREMRLLVRGLAKNRRVLNGFAYTGGFSVAALKGGATHVDSVEISKKVGPYLTKNLLHNQCDLDKHQLYTEDVFSFLSRSSLEDYDLIILDPPAFAKKRSDVDAACRGYKQLLLEVFQKIRKPAMLLFSSCSHYVDEKLLQMLAFQAALERGCTATLHSRHRQAFDHPISLFHPEGEYLKSLLLFIAKNHL